MHNVLFKSDIAALYGLTLKQLQRVLTHKKADFPHWFTTKKVLTRQEYLPITEYLERDLCFEVIPAKKAKAPNVAA